MVWLRPDQKRSRTLGTTIVLERDQTTIVFKKVLAQICENCRKEYVAAAVNTALLRQAEKEWERGIILEMLNFAA
jgi:hypothetical protein